MTARLTPQARPKATMNGQYTYSRIYRGEENTLAGDVDIRGVLVLAEQGQVQEDGERAGVGGEDDQLGGAAVEGFGS